MPRSSGIGSWELAACEKLVEAKGMDEVTQSKKGRVPKREPWVNAFEEWTMAFPLKKAKERIWKEYRYRSQRKWYPRRAARVSSTEWGKKDRSSVRVCSRLCAPPWRPFLQPWLQFQWLMRTAEVRQWMQETKVSLKAQCEEERRANEVTWAGEGDSCKQG